LNEGSESEQPTRRRALKYLKNNKAAGADSIETELLKNLVDAIHEVIQQPWISETLTRSWTIIRNEVYVVSGMSELNFPNKINTPFQNNAHYTENYLSLILRF
jgi:D-mannonate dehydratase